MFLLLYHKFIQRGYHFTISHQIDKTLFTDTSYSLLVCLSAQFYYLNELEKSSEIVRRIYFNFNNVVFNENVKLESHSILIKKAYIVATNNYAEIKYQERNYLDSINLCRQGISLCNKYESTYVLELLYKLLIENYYMLNDIEEAMNNYQIFKSICLIKNKIEYLKKSNEYLNKNYPNLRL